MLEVEYGLRPISLIFCASPLNLDFSECPGGSDFPHINFCTMNISVSSITAIEIYHTAASGRFSEIWK